MVYAGAEQFALPRLPVKIRHQRLQITFHPRPDVFL
jgi:hypothetical protein